RSGDEDDRDVRAGPLDRLANGVEDRKPLDALAAAAGGDAADDVRAVLAHLSRVEQALASGDALDQDARVDIDQDAHRRPPGRLAVSAFATTSFAASAIEVTAVNPASWRIC